jgi:hypothetical protein
MNGTAIANSAGSMITLPATLVSGCRKALIDITVFVCSYR